MPITIIIVQLDGVWRVLRNGERLSAYAFRVDAVDEALELEAALVRDGVAVELLAQTGFGELVRLSRPVIQLPWPPILVATKP